MEKYDVLKLNNQFCFSLYALSKEITKLYKPFLDKLEITYTQYIVLLVLWEQNDISVSELGEKVCLDSGTLTPLLKKLEQNDIILRTRTKDDERVVKITLTEKGLALREKAVEIPTEIAKLANTPIAEILSLRDKLKEIYSNLEK